MIIDAENHILGRTASFVAKRALLGEKIDIVNCEKAVVTGDKKSVLAKHKIKKERGTYKGPLTFRDPGRFFKRAIRGMLPYKKETGKKALKNIKCYTGVPDDLKDNKATKIKKAEISKTSNLRYITVRDICKSLGAKL